MRKVKNLSITGPNPFFYYKLFPRQHIYYLVTASHTYVSISRIGRNKQTLDQTLKYNAFREQTFKTVFLLTEFGMGGGKKHTFSSPESVSMVHIINRFKGDV